MIYLITSKKSYYYLVSLWLVCWKPPKPWLKRVRWRKSQLKAAFLNFGRDRFKYAMDSRNKNNLLFLPWDARVPARRQRIPAPIAFGSIIPVRTSSLQSPSHTKRGTDKSQLPKFLLLFQQWLNRKCRGDAWTWNSPLYPVWQGAPHRQKLKYFRFNAK